jgi:glutamate-1-semialdehyde 2,1-aminomutase
MFGILYEPRVAQPREFRDVMNSNPQLYVEVAYALRERGVEIEPDFREPFFLSAAHSENDIDETLNRFNDAVKAVKKNGK